MNRRNFLKSISFIIPSLPVLFSHLESEEAGADVVPDIDDDANVTVELSINDAVNDFYEPGYDYQAHYAGYEGIEIGEFTVTDLPENDGDFLIADSDPIIFWDREVLSPNNLPVGTLIYLNDHAEILPLAQQVEFDHVQYGITLRNINAGEFVRFNTIHNTDDILVYGSLSLD